MGFELRGFESYLELLWNDRMDVTAAEKVSDLNGDNITYSDTPQQVDIPCLLSFNTADKPVEGGLYEPISITPSIFCSSSVDIKAGDRVTVRKCHADGTVFATYTGTVSTTGMPNTWTNHKEVIIDMKGDA